MLGFLGSYSFLASEMGVLAPLSSDLAEIVILRRARLNSQWNGKGPYSSFSLSWKGVGGQDTSHSFIGQLAAVRHIVTYISPLLRERRAATNTRSDCK